MTQSIETFKGGPDLARCHELSASFDKYQLNFLYPKIKVEKIHAVELQFPIYQRGWFESQLTQYLQHRFVPVAEFFWDYYSATQSGFLGQLMLSVELKRTVLNQPILRLNQLGFYLLSEYEHHFNAPGYDNSGSYYGFNSQINHEDHALKFEPLSGYRLLAFKQHQFVFYTANIRPGKEGYQNRIYCLPIDKFYFLQFRFIYNVECHDPASLLWMNHSYLTESEILDSVHLFT
ncbi:hypothetical protein [Aliikangiella maris]|uniref:DUF2290 domain-containing protein n=2 Tax=Aliikangiella maris TaxID=3162458 RepID=A0ABV3MQU6_9GAMM